MSVEDCEGIRCVDLIQRADGVFCFKEFRRDPEDFGRWSVTADYSNRTFLTRDEAWRAARSTISWLGQILNERRDDRPTSS